MISRTLTAIGAASLIFGSSAAIAQSAAPLSVSPAIERSAADADASSDLRGTTGWVIGAIALALIIWGAIELLDDDEPDSP